MASVEQCRVYAARYKELGIDPNNSARPINFAKLDNTRHQLENLAVIEKSEAETRSPPV